MTRSTRASRILRPSPAVRSVSFAYPFGRRADYTTETLAEVRGAGFDRACSAIAKRHGQEFDQFQIPRVHVDDIDGTAFERLLKDWLDA